jgi:pyruvate kinase
MQPTLTKILATVGPACGDQDHIQRLVEAGVHMFRLNFSHGSEEAHATYVKHIRAVEAALDRPLAILGDLQGPRLRIAGVGDDGLEVQEGQTVVFDCDGSQVSSGEKVLGCTYSKLVQEMEVGQRVLIDQGSIRLLVVEKQDGCMSCSVSKGGVIHKGKGMNLPEADLSVEALSERDWKWVQWALDNGIDMLAQSFVRRAQEVQELTSGMERMVREHDTATRRLPVVAKIEHPRALEDIEGILQAADAIMIARGDLGVEIDLARVPIVQKELTKTAQAYGKPCIVATQMLETMIESPTPTRAEASDVAGAVLDGVDVVMLSGETAIGRYPVQTVNHMSRIARVTEEHLAKTPQSSSAPKHLLEKHERTAALAHGVWTVAQDIDARVIVVWSQGGGGARYLSQNHFEVPIVATTSNLKVARCMQLLRAVIPVQMEEAHGMAAWTQQLDKLMIDRELVEPGDECIFVSGAPLGKEGVTNGMVIHTVGSPDAGFGHRSP